MDNLKDKVFSGFVWKFAERFLVQGVTFVVSLVVSRILAPEDYGLVAMVTVFTNIATVIVANGFNAALIQSPSATEEDFSTLFYISLFFSFVLYIGLFFLAPVIASFYGFNELISVVRILGLTLPISSVSSIQNAYIGRMMTFKKNFIASFIASVLSGVVGIWMALNGFGVWALVGQMLFSSILNCFVQFFIVSWRPKLYFSFKRSIPLLKFGANSLGTDLIGTIFNQINSFIMGKWYSPAELAYYNKGQSFPYLIQGNVSIIIASVMFPALSKCADDKKALKEMLRKTTKLYTYVLTPLYIGLMAVSKNLIIVLLTEKWIFSVPYMCIVCLACILGTISPIDVMVLKAIGRSDSAFRLELIKKPIWILLLFIASLINAYALAFVLVVVTIIELIINAIVINKYLDYSLSEKIYDWVKAMFPSLLMFVVVVAMNSIPINRIILLILQIFIGFVFYLIYSYITKNECFVYLLNIIKSRTKRGNQ